MGKINMTDDQIAALKAVALAAMPQDIDGAEIIDHSEDGGRIIECPVCGGEGTAVLEGEYCNYGWEAIGVQFYGIGNAHGAAEAYFRAASPANVLALIGRIERAEGALLSANKPAVAQVDDEMESAERIQRTAQRPPSVNVQAFYDKLAHFHTRSEDGEIAKEYFGLGFIAGERSITDAPTLTTSPAVQAQSYWTRDQIAAVREDAKRLHAKLTHRQLVDDAPAQFVDPLSEEGQRELYERSPVEPAQSVAPTEDAVRRVFALAGANRWHLSDPLLAHEVVRAARLATPPAQTAQSEAIPTDEQICAMGACASLAESMGNDLIAKHVRDYLAARAASPQPVEQTERAPTEVVEGMTMPEDFGACMQCRKISRYDGLSWGICIACKTTPAQTTTGPSHA